MSDETKDKVMWGAIALIISMVGWSVVQAMEWQRNQDAHIQKLNEIAVQQTMLLQQERINSYIFVKEPSVLIPSTSTIEINTGEAANANDK